ncbi:MAG TPA: helix-turn-helix domain-containing protein [Solirubrobacteraceae bacterium]|nr:helix-turn-helix domain-containing protein [Solirubrobacteraceae bacterium]
MERDLLEAMLAEGLSLAAIGRRVGRHESTVASWLDLHGLRAVSAEKHAARGGLGKEELEALAGRGLSIAQIAAEVDRSKATVRYWLQRYGLKTWSPSGSRRAAESRVARENGSREAQMMCATHGETEFVVDGRGYYRCRKCRAEAVSRRRRKMKRILVEEAGGACVRCGYSKTMRALHFHHVNPAEKLIELNAKGVALSLDTLRAEAQKCVLLCSNCHAEVEDGEAV